MTAPNITEIDRCDILSAIFDASPVLRGLSSEDVFASGSDPERLADQLDAVYAYALEFASDCDWAEGDGIDLAGMAPADVVKNTARHYFGGMAALVHDAIADRDDSMVRAEELAADAERAELARATSQDAIPAPSVVDSAIGATMTATGHTEVPAAWDEIAYPSDSAVHLARVEHLISLAIDHVNADESKGKVLSALHAARGELTMVHVS